MLNNIHCNAQIEYIVSFYEQVIIQRMKLVCFSRYNLSIYIYSILNSIYNIYYSHTKENYNILHTAIHQDLSKHHNNSNIYIYLHLLTAFLCE